MICFQYREDAEKVLQVLPKRFARYGLTLHPTKTRLVPFGEYVPLRETLDAVAANRISSGRFEALLRDLRGLVKVNPLAAFTDDDMALYESLYELPKNPLSERGYPSIGCWPCTRPVSEGDDQRAGRWAGSDKSECGLHL